MAFYDDWLKSAIGQVEYAAGFVPPASGAFKDRIIWRDPILYKGTILGSSAAGATVNLLTGEIQPPQGAALASATDSQTARVLGHIFGVSAYTEVIDTLTSAQIDKLNETSIVIESNGETRNIPLRSCFRGQPYLPAGAAGATCGAPGTPQYALPSGPMPWAGDPQSKLYMQCSQAVSATDLALVIEIWPLLVQDQTAKGISPCDIDTAATLQKAVSIRTALLRLMGR